MRLFLIVKRANTLLSQLRRLACRPRTNGRAALCVLLAVVAVFYSETSHAAEEGRSDARAMNLIFGETVLAESGRRVVEESRSGGAEARLERLRSWVLPQAGRANFRVSTDYLSSTHPLAVSDVSHGGNDTRTKTSSPARQAAIVSPALELVSVASELSRLESLSAEVASIKTASKHDGCYQSALLYLIAIEQRDIVLAETRLNELFDQVLPNKTLLHETREALLLCLISASKLPQLADVIREPISQIKAHYRDGSQRTGWHRYLWLATSGPFVPRPDSFIPLNDPQWIPVSRSTAYEHGSGYPHARWNITPGSARKRSTHGDDFLFYVSPLKGGYAVEAHAQGFGYHDTELMVAGVWTGLLSGHNAIYGGNLRGESFRVDLDKPFTDTNKHGFIHSRTVVDKNIVDVSLNGRSVLKRDLAPQEAPWIAFRNRPVVHGGVDDLSLTGNPEIPKTIAMIGTQSLRGWYDYFQPPDTDSKSLGSWHASVTQSETGQRIAEILSERDDRLAAHSYAERLLKYARPVFEDGVVEYEFFYNEQQLEAHPTVGNQAFLISPAGLSVHQVTDGLFEQRRVRPGNSESISTSDESFPLRLGEWNQVRLRFEGDTLHFELNGKLVSTLPLEMPPIERTFGLFHYADVSGLRVRNLKWTGSWPTELPALANQSLVSPVRKKLQAGEENLVDSLHLVPNETAWNSQRFSILEGTKRADFTLSDEGLTIERDIPTNYGITSFAPGVSLEGDFDYTVTFDQFRGSAPKDGNIGLRINAKASTPIDDGAIFKRMTRGDGSNVLECSLERWPEGTWQGEYFGEQPSETSAGRLRLSRRGDRAYFLFAENDSDIFRLVSTSEFSELAVPRYGLRCDMQMWGLHSKSHVRVKSLDIRAEQITSESAPWSNLSIDMYDKLTSFLGVVLNYDFVSEAPSPADFTRPSQHSPWRKSDGGLRLAHTRDAEQPGNDASISVRNTLANEFDLHCEIGSLKLATPVPGQQSQFDLQLSFADLEQSKLIASIILRPTGRLAFQTRKYTASSNDFSLVRSFDLPLGVPDSLRIARFRQYCAIIALYEEHDADLVLANVTSSQASLSAEGLQLAIQSGHDTETSSVVLQSIEIKARNAWRLPQPRGPTFEFLPSSPNPLNIIRDPVD